MPDSAETTISTLRPRAWWAAAMRAIVSQRGRVDTLVPPNLATTQGRATTDDAGAGSMAELNGGILPANLQRAAFFRAAQQNATRWHHAGEVVAAP